MTTTRQTFDNRRAFGRGFARFDAWFMGQQAPSPDEVWDAFAADVLAPFLAQSPAIWSCGVHPTQRARLATLLCHAAHSKMRLDNCGGDTTFDPHEGQLWDAALRVSRRAVQCFEAKVWREQSEFGGIYGGVAHRLADLYRRAGRTDERALRLYIAVFVGPNAAPITRVGAGAHVAVDALLQSGAALSPSSDAAEIGARYSLCLLLRVRGYGAPWVTRSLVVARQLSPQTGALLDVRLGLTAARDFKQAQAPIIAQLAAILEQLAQMRQAQDQAAARAAQDIIDGELQEMARAQSAAKPKSKPKRKRKAAPNDVPIAAPPPKVSAEQFEFDKLFDEAFDIEPPTGASKPAPKSATKPAPLDDWDDFLAEFERDVGENE